MGKVDLSRGQPGRAMVREQMGGGGIARYSRAMAQQGLKPRLEWGAGRFLWSPVRLGWGINK